MEDFQISIISYFNFNTTLSSDQEIDLKTHLIYGNT